MKAYRALPRFRQGSRLGTWLYRITYNACIDELRRARRGRWLRLEDVKVHDPSPDPGERATDRVAVERALSELPPRQQAVVLLIDGQGFDYQTAAEILGVPEGTVASRLHRAREALSRSLSAEGSRA